MSWLVERAALLRIARHLATALLAVATDALLLEGEVADALEVLLGALFGS